MTTTARGDLERELQDAKFRRYYGAAEAKSELALALAEARHRLGITQEELSRKSGVSQPYIARLESGEANPTVGAIGSILAVLNLRLTMSTAPLLPKLPSGRGDGGASCEDFEYRPGREKQALAVRESPKSSSPSSKSSRVRATH